MKTCIETSSLIPLFAYTRYSVPLYEELASQIKSGKKLVVYEDSIKEATVAFEKAAESVEKTRKFHQSNRLCLIRTIMEYQFKAREHMLFILDDLDDEKLDDLPLVGFKTKMEKCVSLKLDHYKQALSQRPLIAAPRNIITYWYPNSDLLKKFKPMTIEVLEDQDSPPLKKNIDRDIFHFQEALKNDEIDTLIVADSKFKDNIGKYDHQKIAVKTLKTLKPKDRFPAHLG